MTAEVIHNPKAAEHDGYSHVGIPPACPACKAMDAYRAKLAEVVARDWDERATAAGWPPDGEVPV